MKLSIINYGSGVNTSVPAHAKREDEELISTASQIVRERNFGKGALMVAEVMHTDLVNLNYRAYMSKGMDESSTTFFHPHYTPFLMHHEDGAGGMFSGGNPDLLAVGSNIFSKYFRKKVELAKGTASGYVKVATFIGDKTMIGNTRAIDAIQARQVLTLSIGAKVADENYICSICGNSLYSEECNHHVGEKYEKELCYAKVLRPFFREYSAVYKPADIDAVIRRVDIEESNGCVSEGHLIDQIYGMGGIHVYDIMGNIYPSAGIKNTDSEGSMEDKTDASKGAENTLESRVTELEKVVADLRAAGEDRNEAFSGMAESIEELNAVIQEKDKLIAVLAKALNDQMEDFDLEGESEEPEGEEEEPEEGDSDNKVEAETGSEEEVGEQGSSSEESETGTSETPSEDVQDSEETPAQQSATEQSSAAGRTDGKSYREVLRKGAPKFGILSVSSGGRSGAKKVPIKFNI